MAQFMRAQVATIAERLSEPPTRIVAIFGPRQTGKTTAVQQALARIDQEHRFEAIDAPSPDPLRRPLETGTAGAYLPGARRDVAWLVDVWEDSRRRAWSSPVGYVLVLDEIQKMADWADAVKGLWDADRAAGCPLHVVVLGSAPLLMQAGLNESLAGRFEPVGFPHWSYAEMADAFDVTLDQYVYFGGYPGAAARIHDHDRWHTYVRSGLVEPNIERDVLQMTRVDKPALLRRLFDMGAQFSGQVLSYNKMLGHLQDAGNTTTLTRYLGLLSQAGLLTGLRMHTERPVSAKASTPKLNVLNTALMSMASGYTFEEARADRTFWGHLTESAVGAHLVNTSSAGVTVEYWRNRHRGVDVEVDFVLGRGPHLVGIEVKSGRTPARLPGLDEFMQRFNARGLVIGSQDVTLDEFLSQPASDWLTSP